MPEIGEIRKGNNRKSIWHACEVCGKERWTTLVKGLPRRLRCQACKSLRPVHAGTKKGQELGFKSHCRVIWSACEICGKERWVQFSIKNAEPKNKRCGSCTQLAKKGGRIVGRGGYVFIYIRPDDFFYPMAIGAKTRWGGYVPEHRLVVAKALGRCLNSYELVHHKGTKYPQSTIENKQDNRYPENLELTTRGNHILEHDKGYENGYLKGFQNGRSKQVQELKAQNKELLKQIKLLQRKEQL